MHKGRDVVLAAVCLCASVPLIAGLTVFLGVWLCLWASASGSVISRVYSDECRPCDYGLYVCSLHVLQPCYIGSRVFLWPWATTWTGLFNFMCLSLFVSVCMYLCVWLCVCVCVCGCACPEDRAVTEVNGAVSVCNVILTVTLAQAEHGGTVVEIKLGLFHCLSEGPQWSNL